MLNVTARQDLMNKIVETLGVVVEDARFEFKENQMQATVVDASHVAMIDMKVDAAAFDTWEVVFLDLPRVGKELLELFESSVEENLIEPTFVIGYPVEVSPLSRRNNENPEIADRFELFIGGKEIANGFCELNDPDDQADRFREQVKAKDTGDKEAMSFDEDYVTALEHGMPPAVGVGIGIDRLVMMITNQTSIRDVILFPQLKS